MSVFLFQTYVQFYIIQLLFLTCFMQLMRINTVLSLHFIPLLIEAESSKKSLSSNFSLCDSSSDQP